MQNKTPLNEPFSSTDDALGENFRLLILQEAFDELHTFIFAKVYTNPACKSEEKKAVNMIQQLYYHFAKKLENLPPQFREIAERDGIGTAACDFIAGMTDRYAVRVFESLYIPQAWSKTDDWF